MYLEAQTSKVKCNRLLRNVREKQPEQALFMSIFPTGKRLTSPKKAPIGKTVCVSECKWMLPSSDMEPASSVGGHCSTGGCGSAETSDTSVASSDGELEGVEDDEWPLVDNSTVQLCKEIGETCLEVNPCADLIRCSGVVDPRALEADRKGESREIVWTGCNDGSESHGIDYDDSIFEKLLQRWKRHRTWVCPHCDGWCSERRVLVWHLVQRGWLWRRAPREDETGPMLMRQLKFVGEKGTYGSSHKDGGGCKERYACPFKCCGRILKLRKGLLEHMRKDHWDAGSAFNRQLRMNQMCLAESVIVPVAQRKRERKELGDNGGKIKRVKVGL